MNKLTNSQLQAFNKFSKLKVGALFMEMGTGKTITAIELINYNINRIDLILWLTPCSTINNLKQEIEKWGGFNKELIIFGWETLSQSTKKYLELLDKIKEKKIFIVADESIFIKNGDTKRYQRLMYLSKNSEYRLILNGTPLTKNEWDLYYQMNFLSEKIIGMSEREFLNTFFKKITYKKRDMKREKTFYKLSENNMEYLNKLIEPYIFKVSLDFEKQETENYNLVSPEPETLKELNYFIKQEIKDILELNDKNKMFCLLTKLNYKSSIDENKINEVVKYINNKRILCFCSFVDEVKKISKKIDCFVITGETKNKERDEIINEFKNNNKPLILTFGCGSYGLNLQFCNEVVFSSLTFDYSKILQSKARIKRIGQNENIKYSYFIVDTKINRLIFNNIDNKKELENEMFKYLKEWKNESV